jgi:hypothetical protein
MPAGFAVRVGYATRKLPYPVKVHLPPASGKPRDAALPVRTKGADLDLVPPASDERHLKLGHFLDAWSRLENTVVFTLSALLETDFQRARMVMSTLSTKQVIDLLNSLVFLQLKGPKLSRLTNLTERLGRLNSKRNVLVHGHWVLEGLVSTRRGDAILTTQFIRETSPSDPEIAKKILDPKSQKQRVKHCFTLRRIDGATGDANQLISDFAVFTRPGPISSEPAKA